MTMRFNQPVNTPDGTGIYIAPMGDGSVVQVALKIPAAKFDDDELARFCPRYTSMTTAEQKSYRKKATFPIHRIFDRETLEQLNG